MESWDYETVGETEVAFVKYQLNLESSTNTNEVENEDNTNDDEDNYDDDDDDDNVQPTCLDLQLQLYTAANDLEEMKDIVMTALEDCGFAGDDIMLALYAEADLDFFPEETFPGLLKLGHWLLARGAYVPPAFRVQPEPWRPVPGDDLNWAHLQMYQRTLHFLMARATERREYRAAAPSVVVHPWHPTIVPRQRYREPFSFVPFRGSALRTEAQCALMISKFKHATCMFIPEKGSLMVI